VTAERNENLSNEYGFGTTLNLPYDDVMPLVTAALKAEGFGVLTEIDVKQTLREKLGAEMEPYAILGACNPPLAHEAITQEPQIGLLLPCNVVVRATSEGTRVEVADPEAMLGIVGNERIEHVAHEAKQKLTRVIAALAAQHAAPAAR
jgi:uncharacterized protein (DUF302 family)